MRSLTGVGFSLMFLGPLVVLLRLFGVILVDDVCVFVRDGGFSGRLGYLYVL